MNREIIDQKNRMVRKLEQLKNLISSQVKINDFIQNPVKSKELVDSFGEPMNPKYYQMVQFYFDRIPALKPYRPVDSNKYRTEQAKFFKLQSDQSQVVGDLKEWSFLPYSEHRHLGVMSMDMRITLDAVNPTNAKAIELRVKKAFIASKVKELMSEYSAQLPTYQEEIEEFIVTHSNQIIEKRTELMIDSKPEVLEIILNHLKALNNEELQLGTFSHTDYLPFADCVPAIVESMEDHPVKPKLVFVGFSKE